MHMTIGNRKVTKILKITLTYFYLPVSENGLSQMIDF